MFNYWLSKVLTIMLATHCQNVRRHRVRKSVSILAIVTSFMAGIELGFKTALMAF